MGYRLLADLVVGLHVAYLLFLAAGALLSWRWPKLLWLHVPSVAWALVSITVRVECPLTALEQALRRRADGQSYTGGFIDHYITGHLYPAWLSVPVGTAIGVAVFLGYLRLWQRSSATRVRQPTR
jgi:hypothetical protein